MKWNFSCSALLHTKTIVSLKYFVNDCSWFWYLYMSAKNVRHFWNNSYSGIFFEVSFRGVQNELNLPNSLKFFVYFLQINSTISLLHEKKKKKKKKKNSQEKSIYQEIINSITCSKNGYSEWRKEICNLQHAIYETARYLYVKPRLHSFIY